MSKETLFKALPVIILSSLLVVAIIYAWTEPTAAPPGGNVAAPLNVGNNIQTKQGSLILNSAGVNPYGLTVNREAYFLQGNVGIGTTTPAYKLDVAGGDINVSGVYRKGGTAGTSISCGAGNTPSGITISGGIITSAGGCATIGGGGGFWAALVNDIYNTNTGNVGIGTTAPLDPPGVGLTVTSGVRDNRITIGDPGKNWSWATGWATQGDFSLIEEGVAGDRIYVKPGGNVGIGTESPSQKLDVAGYVKGSSGLCIGNDCRSVWPLWDCTTVDSGPNPVAPPVTVNCPGGYAILSGGFKRVGTITTGVDSFPSGNGWRCGGDVSYVMARGICYARCCR